MLYRMIMLIALIAGPAFGQFGSGDYHGARWDPTLRCWVFPDGKNTAGVPWNQRLLKGDATGDKVVDGVTGPGDGAGPKVDPFASQGPPFEELFKSASDITLDARNEIAVTEIIRQASADAAAVRSTVRLPEGTTYLQTTMDTEGQVLGQFRMPDSTVFSIDVAVAKSRNSSYYANAAALQPLDQTLGLATGQGFSNRTFRYLALPRFPDGLDVPPLPAPAGAEPLTGVNPFPQLPEELRKRLEEARKKLEAKAKEEAALNAMPPNLIPEKELLDALDAAGKELDRNDPRRKLVGAGMIVVGDSIVLQTIGSQIIQPYDPPAKDPTSGFSIAPRKLGDGTLHYPYVAGLPITDNYLRPDGGLVSVYGDGSKEYTAPDGSRVLRTRDGYKRVISADGTVTWFDPQGRLVQMEDPISTVQQVLLMVQARTYLKDLSAQYDTEIPLAGISQLYSNNGAFFPEEK